MSAEKTKLPNPNDPYFIPSVPTYLNNLGEENDDTIGDLFFQKLTLQENHDDDVPQQKPPLQQRPMRRSQFAMLQNTPVKQPSKSEKSQEKEDEDLQQKPPLKNRPQRRSHFVAAQNQPAVQPPKLTLEENVDGTSQQQQQKPPLQQRPMRRSHFVVQPPMRFGNCRPSETPISRPSRARSIIPKQPSSKPQVGSSKPSAAAAGSSKVPPLQSPAGPSKPPLKSTAGQSKLIQPPMRFGMSRRSEAPMTPTTVRGKSAGISHAVRGLTVVQAEQKKKQK